VPESTSRATAPTAPVASVAAESPPVAAEPLPVADT
jgi:hypothetical protein